jgi:hypothetical protein
LNAYLPVRALKIPSTKLGIPASLKLYNTFNLT